VCAPSSARARYRTVRQGAMVAAVWCCFRCRRRCAFRCCPQPAMGARRAAWFSPAQDMVGSVQPSFPRWCPPGDRGARARWKVCKLWVAWPSGNRRGCQVAFVWCAVVCCFASRQAVGRLLFCFQASRSSLVVKSLVCRQAARYRGSKSVPSRSMAKMISHSLRARATFAGFGP